MNRINVTCVFASLAVLCASQLNAADEIESSGAPPEIALAVVLDDHTLEVRRFVQRMVNRTTSTALPPGLTVEMQRGAILTSRTETVPVTETHHSKVKLADIAARRVNGQSLDQKALRQELNKPTAVILSNSGQQIHRPFASIFNPQTPVLQLPLRTTTSAPNLRGTSQKVPTEIEQGMILDPIYRRTIRAKMR